VHDAQNKSIRISDDQGGLELWLSYSGQCVLDRVVVRGHSIVSKGGVFTGIKVDHLWETTRSGVLSVRVQTTGNSARVEGVRFGGKNLKVEEVWTFITYSNRVVWQIDRTYVSGGTLEDAGFPEWDFQRMSSWTGALLGHGGVAWCKLFDAPNATYGVHGGEVVLWNKETQAGLRISPQARQPSKMALRFSRQPDGVFSLSYYLSHKPLAPKHGLSRFLHNAQDVWAPFEVKPGKLTVEYSLAAFDYEKEFPLGDLKNLNVTSIRELRHTIARIGAVDELLHGSNGFYSDCAVLHEPWIAQLGLLIDDPSYDRALADTLDFQREHAINSEGRVKSRWAGTPGDAISGTYDRFGYYEAQWGYLMDSQPSWVINVAELFDLNGDTTWLGRQKSTCERVLDYLLDPSVNGDGLVKMATDSCDRARGSDWLDVIWASYENSLVNAQMYWAMTLWAELEQLLGDQTRAERYRGTAAKLKHRFNLNTADGGFWNPDTQCYAYWREKNGVVHGTNLVIPVNFSAIGYGLCDDPERRAIILGRIEELMQQEKLFFWPLCFFSYAPGEAHPSQYPFPTYENGDLFLGWGELGTRAYAPTRPEVALKYVHNVLDQYDRDGLAFQRYGRRTQKGIGNDILANNASTLVGLYRNIYGIQPRYNRFFLDPHLVPELDGTRISYQLRGQRFGIDLSVASYRVTVDDFAIHDTESFGLNAEGDNLRYFFRNNSAWALSVARPVHSPMEVRIETWSDAPSAPRRWSESFAGGASDTRYVIASLRPGARYHLVCQGRPPTSLKADAIGRVEFSCKREDASPRHFELTLE
jgi:hypothetical protein